MSFCHLTFRSIKELDWDACIFKVRQLIQDEYSRHYYLLKINTPIWISGTHTVRSNRESGYGRYDIMIIPKWGNGETGTVRQKVKTG